MRDFQTMDENTIRRTHADYPLLITVVLLAGIGLIMVYSASAVLAQEKFGSSLYFFKRMAVHALLGFLFLSLLMRVSYFQWRRLVYPVFIFCLAAMGLVLFSSWGVTGGGARRWLHLGFFTVQPSELAKFAVLLFMAYTLEKKDEKMEKFSVGVFPPLVITGLLIFLVLLSRDLGSAFVMGALVAVLLFLGGARLKHLALLTLAALPFLYHLILQETYRLKRVLSFLNPWDDRYGSGFQIIQSFLAFNEGGLTGKGLGAGQQKLFYLPEAHTDFIFSVLGEELGLIGVMLTIGLFSFLIYRGIRIASRACCPFGRYLALGIVSLIGIQSILNMAVVMGLLPTKGLVLPFVGYGGSSLMVSLAAIGILLNISTIQKANTPPMYDKGARPL